MSDSQQGPTPLGGDNSVATYYDGDGNEVDDPTQAASIEIVEKAGPHELGRTYLDRTSQLPPGPVYRDPGTTLTSPDVEDHHGKTVWQLSNVNDGIWSPVLTKDDLLTWLGVAGQPQDVQRQALGDAMMAAAWPSAPDSLKNEVEAWLIATSPHPNHAPQPRPKPDQVPGASSVEPDEQDGS